MNAFCACVILVLFTSTTSETNQPSNVTANNDADTKFDDENRAPPPSLNFSSYFNYDEILGYARPDHPLLKWSKIGTTLGKKDLWVMTIRNPKKQPKRAVFIDALMIPCEYHTASIVMYLVNQLLTNSSNYQDILDTTTIYIVPIANRDGFEQNFPKTKAKGHDMRERGVKLLFDETFKNLNKVTPADCAASFCDGTNIALNFPFQWTALPAQAIRNFTYGKDMKKFNEVFQFNSPISPHYRGASPCSENECQAILNFLKDHKEIDTYVTLHGFINFWALPFAYKDKARPENYDELGRLASAITEAINEGSIETSRYGPFETMFDLEETEIFNGKEHPGTPLDYAKSLGIRFTFWAGFGEYNNARYLEKDILRVCQDALRGFLVLLRLKDKYGRPVFPSKSARFHNSSVLSVLFYVTVQALTIAYWVNL